MLSLLRTVLCCCGCGARNVIQLLGVNRNGSPAEVVDKMRASDVRDAPDHVQSAFTEVEKSPSGLPLVILKQCAQQSDMCVVHLHGGANVSGPQSIHWDFLANVVSAARKRSPWRFYTDACSDNADESLGRRFEQKV